MTQNNKRVLQIVVVMFIVLMMPMLAMADNIDPVPGEPDAPIDGGLSLLIAAGVGYGAKKMKERKVTMLNKN